MKATEELKKFKSMKKDELIKERIELAKKSALLALKVKAGKEEDYSKISKNKKELARLATLIHEKESGEKND